MPETNEPKKELTITRTFNAPLESVWKAWTDEKIVRKWWGPRGVSTPICEVDPRKGGKLNIVMEAGKELGNFAGQKWPMSAVFTEVTPQSRLVFVGGALDDVKKMLFESEVTVDFKEVGGKTKINIHILITKTTDSPAVEFAIKGMEAGWNQQTDKLGELLGSM